ncbi:kinase-like protein [Gigaspora margarita]|uniref:Kinase-like protein n=1 Tax=Gigaspora margarita TaxID=4874 RepID=A0A8H4A8H7_GIGMA|nr:kinase-like protein [Gigaspora margarita]
MTSRTEPKLANFHFARMSEGILTDIEYYFFKSDSLVSIRKMVENMCLNAKKKRYTQQCEIFSFGMMLWELFRKFPYHGKDIGYFTNDITKVG